jgi:hypothetical protein
MELIEIKGIPLDPGDLPDRKGTEMELADEGSPRASAWWCH